MADAVMITSASIAPSGRMSRTVLTAAREKTAGSTVAVPQCKCQPLVSSLADCGLSLHKSKRRVLVNENPVRLIRSSFWKTGNALRWDSNSSLSFQSTTGSTGQRNSLLVEAKARSSKAREEVDFPAPDYRLAIGFLGVAGVLASLKAELAAAPVGLLGILLLVQTPRVRFTFGKDAFAIRVGDELKESGENVFVGGKNQWRYDTFVNWELWWPEFPILAYFKETQTKPEGQIHFFPVTADGKRLYELMVAKWGSSKNSLPEKE
eukprot:TRINITY_DN1022_c0_g1_i13.p1 TRINITY_DN1022_c0_g1~~TRINITY_DN1022_c0_g1_i13.p1  ORF type:complete len:264 (-),score=33.25 TRINITY_DN1022_c0_g1_i13:131-922(-)